MTTTHHLDTDPTTPRLAAAGRSSATRAERRLRTVFGVNATLSIVVGAALAIAPGAIDDLLGTGRPGWVRVVGLGLVLFAIDVAWVSRRPRDQLVRFAPVVIAADVAWVVASVATLLLGWFSGGGIAAVIAVAVAVDAFATLQFLTWRTLRGPR